MFPSISEYVAFTQKKCFRGHLIRCFFPSILDVIQKANVYFVGEEGVALRMRKFLHYLRNE